VKRIVAETNLIQPFTNSTFTTMYDALKLSANIRSCSEPRIITGMQEIGCQNLIRML